MPNLTEQKAIECVKNWFRKKGIELQSPDKDDFGFDLKTPDGKKFIEVKGTTKTTSAQIGFRYLTNFEYVKAKKCKQLGLDYEVHLVTGINSESPSHYIIPATDFIDKTKPEVWWYFPIRKADLEKYKI